MASIIYYNFKGDNRCRCLTRNKSQCNNKAIYKSFENDDIIYWASEELAIPYYNPVTKRVHKYFPDFIIKTSKGKRFMIEIKPAKYLKPPKPQAKRTKRFFGEQVEFIKNQAKWKAASNYCEEQGMEFKVFTEKELGIY